MLESARIRTYIKDRGPQPVLAGTDCGCGTFAGIGKMDADISYQKLAALLEGRRSLHAACGKPRIEEAILEGC